MTAQQHNTPHPPARRTTRPGARRLALTGLAAAAALLLAACGGTTEGNPENAAKHGGTPSATAGTTGANPAPGPVGDTDVMFAQMMIPHHQQALEMARLADGRAADPEIKKLVAAIEQAQDPEIQRMRSWLKAWGKPESAGSMPGMDHGSGSMDHGSMGHGSGMSGMMSEKDMKELKAAKGRDFDRKFASMMIEHHRGAIDMAEDEQKNGRNATAKKLADDVVRGQSAEVARMKKLLDRL
ncbi:DUF305 domain-containing protein [Streptomyces noursei]|uniref:DUF305 domain-containing protein n=1 Tax=Streptomyces noursei TaxID=1971 RepID=UPI00167C3147|nr:DUF305 domain-containing protein [Streptomyces noursei]MCZ1019147.1 DUF305 domain-containing protein [Streptomyces noursei]GGX46972.1 hypothetical protein GCM10010341_80890 [Streptomyces noursei]